LSPQHRNIPEGRRLAISSMKTRLSQAITVICTVLVVSTFVGCPPQNNSSASIPADVQHSAALGSWYAYYEAAARPPSQPTPSLQQKYSAEIMAPGLYSLVQAEYARLVKSLPNAPPPGLLPEQINIAICDPKDVILIRTNPSAAGKPAAICVSPLLITSVFLQNAGTSLLAYDDRLKSFGIEPANFNGAYDPLVAQQNHLSQDDWNSVLGIEGNVWNSLISCLDFIIAQQLIRATASAAVPMPSQQSIDGAAKALVIRSGTTWYISALVSLLQSNLQKYSAGEWGYEALGDGAMTLAALSQL
jgi:hypothetical protein